MVRYKDDYDMTFRRCIVKVADNSYVSEGDVIVERIQELKKPMMQVCVCMRARVCACVCTCVSARVHRAR